MNNKSKFKLSAKKNPKQIDHLGRERILILNQALPRRPQQILQGQSQAGSRRTTMMQSII